MSAPRGARRRRRRVAVAASVLVVAAALGCRDRSARSPSPVTFDTAAAWVLDGADSTRLLVEVAETPAQREYGLMRRESLDPGSGMIFLFDTVQADTSGFWMWRTEIPLDIAFTDGAGAIRAIRSMPPCESWAPQGCPIYAPGVEYRRALEVNQGWFARHGVEVGDTVRLEGGAPRSATR